MEKPSGTTFFQERLRDNNDSIHQKTDEEIFQTSTYDNGEPVVRTKYPVSNFKANFKRLKATIAHNKAAAMHGHAAL